jgi:hypothetical protein
MGCHGTVVVLGITRFLGAGSQLRRDGLVVELGVAQDFPLKVQAQDQDSCGTFGILRYGVSWNNHQALPFSATVIILPEIGVIESGGATYPVSVR